MSSRDIAAMQVNPICPYCRKPSHETTGKTIYPHRRDLHSLKFYHCPPCDAYVGCHKNSGQPLGRLADSALRLEKMKAHAAFDPIWKGGHMSRSEAYSWLAKMMNISTDQCHIGMFDIDQCKTATYHARVWRKIND